MYHFLTSPKGFSLILTIIDILRANFGISMSVLESCPCHNNEGASVIRYYQMRSYVTN